MGLCPAVHRTFRDRKSINDTGVGGRRSELGLARQCRSMLSEVRGNMRKLATAALAFSAATVISRLLPSYDLLLMFCAITALLSLCAFFFSGNTRLRVLIAVLALASGFLWNWVYAAVFVSPAQNMHDKKMEVTAVVSDYPSATTRGFRIDVKIRAERGPAIGARLYYYQEQQPKPGDVIVFTASFRRTDGADGSDRVDALSSRGNFLAAYLTGDIQTIGSTGTVRYFPQRLAQGVNDIIDSIYPADSSPFVKALLIGRRDELSGDAGLTAALSASGVSHVVAISGMHVSFLMGLLAMLIKNKRLFSLLGIPILLLFAAMTGFTPSVTRAVVMQVMIVMAPVFKRESDGLTSLSAALMILLIANPYSCTSAGLQLSFAATLGIMLFTGRIDASVTGRLQENFLLGSKAAKSAVRFITSSVATTVGALVFTIPLTAVHFGQISLIAPLTNLLTLWAVSIAFPLGIVSCVLGMIFMPLGSAAALIVSVIVRYITGVARVLAGVPYSSIYTSQSPVLLWLVYVYIMFVLLPLLKSKARQYLYAVCLALISLCAVLLLSPRLPSADGAAITVLNIGQGQSVVLTSGGHTAMIDCGSSSGENAGALAHEFLSGEGITSIELLILTHFHADHVNGVEYLLSRVNVSALVIPDPEDSYVAEDIIELARKRGADIIYVTETYCVSLGDEELYLYPPIGYGDDNERGLSVLCLGSLSALITGDMTASGERSLLRYAVIPNIDLLIVGHHGSRFSTSEELLSAARPAIAAISVGRNSYGHPSNDTLERLCSYGAVVMRTDQAGNISVGGNKKHGG